MPKHKYKVGDRVLWMNKLYFVCYKDSFSRFENGQRTQFNTYRIGNSMYAHYNNCTLVSESVLKPAISVLNLIEDKSDLKCKTITMGV